MKKSRAKIAENLNAAFVIIEILLSFLKTIAKYSKPKSMESILVKIAKEIKKNEKRRYFSLLEFM